jgi:hypothetical protein
MNKAIGLAAVAVSLLAARAMADSTGFTPIATGFTLPAANQAQSALNANYATTAGSSGYATSAATATSATSATNAGYATSAGSAKSADSASTADSATYAKSSGTAAQAAALTASNTCPDGTALSVTKGVLGCVSSVTSITGTLDGSQIVGNITNVGVVRASGNIVAGGNLVATGYVNGNDGLYSGNGVYATDYYGRGGGSNANFNGTASAATTAGSANYATTAGSTNYAASTDVGILYQRGSGGDGSTFYCDSGYYLQFYDLNVNSTNNAFFYQCVQNGH